MTTRIIVAGIIGGIAMFIWTSIAHTKIPALYEAGWHEMPNESDFMVGMKANFGGNRGLYMFPGSGLGHDATPEQRREAREKNMNEKVESGPSGILLYRPAHPVNMPRLLGIEFGNEVLEAILVMFLLSSTRLLTAGSRILFVTIAGALVAIGTNVSYWNWYGFPKRYVVAQMVIQIVGFFLVGIVGAMVLKNHDPARSTR